MKTPITVVLAEDHCLVRRGFRRILEDDPDIRVVAEAGDGREAVEAARKLRPRVVVLDMAMPELDGLEAARQIRSKLPGTAILILSMYSDEAYVRNALEAGARGYLLKNAIEVDLTGAVKAVAAGKEYIGPGLLDSSGPAGDGCLTQREKQVLQLVAQGKANKEIAVLLNLSVNTVSVHRANLMRTLDIHGTADLVLYAIKNGLVPLP